MRVRPCLLLAVLAAMLVFGDARAAPPSEDQLESNYVLPPGLEPVLRELLEPVVRQTPPDLHWLGPTIEFDRVKWWLMRGEQAEALLLLLPRELGEPANPFSSSFAIQVAWAPDHQAEPGERELVEQAIDAVQSGDHGQFYMVREQAPVNHPAPDPEAEPPPPYAVQPADDPDAVRRQWLLEFGSVLTLAMVSLALVMRPRRK